METFQFRAMNTDIVLAAEGESDALVGAFLETRRLIEAFEARFTRFNPESELCRLNRAAGAWFMASPELFELLSLARDYYYRTNGLFDPGILKDLQRAGYTRSLELVQSAPDLSPPVVDEALPRAYFGEMLLDEDTGAVWLPPGLQIDLGGIAKGWIAERGVEHLAQWITRRSEKQIPGASPACAVSAGGDIALVGLPAGQPAWQIDLEDPTDPNQDLATLQVGPGALATSTITRRTWHQNGQPRHHLIDPRRGEPADGEWLSVTVFAPDAPTAEVFAKAYLFAGGQEAIDLWQKNPGQAFIAVDRQGNCWGSPEFQEVFHVIP